MATPNPVDAPAAEPPPGDPLIGRTIDARYKVTARLGAGGMGAVYRVEHQTLGKAFALKVLHPRLGSLAEAGKRFEREALAGGRIGHPNCVAVSDFGVFDDGAFYLVMELLDGETLGDLLDREPRLPWRRALLIARHVLRGLGHAHDHGVIHRDIKPDNIFVAHTEDDADVAKILDFGIAKLVGEGSTNITQAGITIGTPAYLSPEQAFGGELDGRSDLYSLSVLLFEMLVGRTPFGDRDALGMLTAHAVAEVPAMAEVAPDAEIPRGVEALVRHGLAKTPGDRINSAAEYVQRIDELLGRMATPLPMRLSAQTPAVSGSHAIATPAPAYLTTPLATPSLSKPSPRRLAAYVAGGILGVGMFAAVAARCGGGGGGSATAPAAIARIDAAVAKANPPEPKPAVLVPPKPMPTPEPAAAPDAGAAVAPASDEYTAAIAQLTKGKTCPDRKKAVAELRALGDKRAIPALKKARYRMYGGVLGLGRKNANSCLSAAASAAVEELSKKP